MEIRNLMTFLQVAELNSFTKAARALDYSQSTVSFQIKQLETELGCLLFERINHTLSLTERGKELLEYAKQIRYLTDEFNQGADKERGVSGSVRLVTPDSVCEELIKRHYVDFYRRYPDISLKFTTADTGDMFRILDRNEADLMLTLDTHVYQRDYVIAREQPVRMHFVTGARSPYVTPYALGAADLTELPFILTERGFGYRRVFDEMMAKSSLEIRPVLELGRPDIITHILAQGVGVSFLPDFVTEQKVAAGELCYLHVPEITENVWKQLIYHKNKWVTAAMRAVIEYIKEKEFGI